jgi:hypothetical protein
VFVRPALKRANLTVTTGAPAGRVLTVNVRATCECLADGHEIKADVGINVGKVKPCQLSPFIFNRMKEEVGGAEVLQQRV